jgi:DNA modification methylase
LGNSLYYGDNLEVLPTLADESVDLIYLDPPFNSACNYNVIFARSAKQPGNGASAQIQAFEDTWTWNPIHWGHDPAYPFAAMPRWGKAGAEITLRGAR